jgi:CubicO group peptidase (beta-lactamase class C family)
MIRSTCASFALLLAAPVVAQSEQERLDARYDRALAAGYKALTLCSALFNAKALRTERTIASVEANELIGIYPQLDALVRELPATVERSAVSVPWADGMAPRRAVSGHEGGCALLPIGSTSFAAPNVVVTSYERRRPEARPWPEGNLLPKASPRPSKALASAIEDAFGHRHGQGNNTTAVVVLKSGALIAERYKHGFGPLTPQRTWSVAKSIAATLIGVAVQRGEIKVSDSAGLGRGADDPRRAITVDHLLRMASGRYSDTPGNRTDAVYFGGATVDETARDWPLITAPGSTFRYANNDTLMAVEVIAPTFKAHPPRTLFQKLGMHSTIAETDWQGNYILSSQVWSTARDLAKLGQLYLQRGEWNGEQVIPEDWLDYVSRPSGPQPAGEFGYGASFWLLNKTEGLPADTIAMQGNRGQYVVIVPSRNIVIVRRGEDPAGSRFDIGGFARDVLRATGS